MTSIRERARQKFEEEQRRKQEEGGAKVAAAAPPLTVTPRAKLQTQGPTRMIRESLAMMPSRRQTQIPIEQVFVPDHFRRHAAEYEGSEFDELVESMRQSNGNLDPIDVRFKPDEAGRPRFELITGTRRLEATRRLGLSVIFATEREIDDATADVLHDIENAKRAEKRPFSLAIQLSNMMKSGRYESQTDLADRLGRSKGVVSTYLAVYDKAPNDLWARVKDPIELKKAEAELLVKAYDKPAFSEWVKSLKKTDPAPLATVVRKAREATARPKPAKTDVDKIRELERGDSFHIVLPKSLPTEVRAKVLAFAKELVGKL
jgi:ParB/RepB/Spo0J family partition protein